MEMTRTYPPEVEVTRQGLVDLIGEIKLRYERRLSPPSAEATASEIVANSFSTPQQFADMHRAYLLEIEPIVKRLADLEGFATLTMNIPA